MSGQLKNNAGERKLGVTLLSAEWKALGNGDLTTINRELAIQMAKHPNVEVSVFLPQCSEEDKKDADSYNVKLIEAAKLGGFEPVDWLASVPDSHAMDCVLGHGVVLGRQIQLIKKNPSYNHCKWIQVVHTAPEEIGMYKSISEGQKKQQTEIELCEMADQVVTIGPKLTDAYKYQLRTQDVFNLTPSIFTEFLEVQPASDERRTFCVLVIESGESEDFYVKGYDLAAKAIADLKDKSYQLKFASKQRGKEDELADKLLQCGIGRNQLSMCSLDEGRVTLAKLFSVVDIAILPSKTEGFGLSALQALSAGLPVLVSGNSGIAEALKEVSNGSECIVDSEEPADWAREIKAVRNKTRKVQLAEAKILRQNYLQQFSWEKPCDSLVEKMHNLAFGNKQTSNSEHENGGACSSTGKKQTWNSEPENGGACSSSGGNEQVICDLQQWQQNASRYKNSSNTDPLSNLKKIASEKGYKISDNQGSGNCMFYALSEQLETVKGVKIHHFELRRSLVQYLRKHPKQVDGTDLFHFVDRHTTWGGYLTGMEQDGTWGDHVILWAAANYYQIAIHVISSLPGYSEVIIKPDCPFDQSKHLVLGHVHEVHYCSLQPLQDLGASLCKETEQEPFVKEIELQDVIRSRKHNAPSPSNVNPVVKKKSEVSKEVSDPVPGPAAVEHGDSLSILEDMNSFADNNTQSIPLPATETSDSKGGVSVETRGWNALHSAVRGGDEAIIETFLSSGLDIDSRGNDGTTPLMLAAAKGDEKTVDLLLSKGADPHLKTFIGRNLLHAAAEGGNISIVKSMLSRGIDIDSKDDEFSFTPLHKGLDVDSRGETLGLTPLMVSIKCDKLEAAKYLLEKGANESLKTTLRKIPILSIASTVGSVAAIEMLLSRGCSIDSRDDEGETPLMHAARCGNTEIVEYLLAQGADPLLRNTSDLGLLHLAALSGNVLTIKAVLSKNLDINAMCTDLGITPLLFCLSQGKLEAANYLLAEGADENLKSKDGWTVLSAAAMSGNVAAIEMLLKRGHNPNSRDGCDKTPLMWAAEKTMLSKGLDIDSRGETQGETPLMVSIASGKLEAAKYLLEKGADESLKSTPGKIPLLSIASGAGSIAAIEMLLSHGCNIDSRDGRGDTALMRAAHLGNTEVVEYLLAKGANPLLLNNLEFGLLHLAALSDNVLTIKAVLSKNFDINARCTVLGVTPLLFCLAKSKLKAANYLLAMGADENLKTKDGLTVLSAAAFSGNVAAIEMLLKRGHNPNSRDGSDKTPLMWAAEKGNKAAVEFLLPLTH